MTNNISCIIVDDEPDAIELLCLRLSILYPNITVANTYSRWESAFKALQTEQCDLLLMDISLPGKNAIELLRLLPNIDCETIFVTAHEDYALDAFSFSTSSGYILKPIDDADLVAAIDKAIKRIQNKRIARQTTPAQAGISDKLAIAQNNGIDYVNIRDILYLAAINKCTRIVTISREHISSQNIGRFYSILEKHSFFQVHRSYIINLNCILRYESSGVVIMSNKEEIPVSRNIKSDFLKIFNATI